MATPPERTSEAGTAARSQASSTAATPANMEFILDVPIEVTVELGRTKLLVNELLKLGQGSVIELSMSTFLMLLTSSPSCFASMLRTLTLLARLHSAAMHAKLFVVVCVHSLYSHYYYLFYFLLLFS